MKNINNVPERIAIIEDDHAIAQMYQFKLKHHGYDVRIAYDGAEGLKLVQNFAPALVLLDLKMPHMNGDEMLEQMRATDWGSLPRVVILTNISRAEAPMRLRFLNVERYIVKAHHTPQQIVSIIEDILK